MWSRETNACGGGVRGCAHSLEKKMRILWAMGSGQRSNIPLKRTAVCSERDSSRKHAKGRGGNARIWLGPGAHRSQKLAGRCPACRWERRVGGACVNGTQPVLSRRSQLGGVQFRCGEALRTHSYVTACTVCSFWWRQQCNQHDRHSGRAAHCCNRRDRHCCCH